MTELQLISRILNQHSLKIYYDNNLDLSYFVKYTEEMNYILEHEKEFGTVPDKVTFLSQFQDFDIIEVLESDKYLIDTIQEEHLYSNTVPIINKLAELMQSNSYDAVNFLISKIPQLQKSSYKKQGVDIVHEAQSRFLTYQETKENPDGHYIETGFKELDDLIGGWHKGEEFVCIFARTGQGKTWVTLKMLTHAWKMGETVGLIEPEMTADIIGYRFDTLYKHFSNFALLRGREADGYEEYINDLQNSDAPPFFVSHPTDFDREITVTKLKTFCMNNNIGILVIDGIVAMKDERAKRNDNTTTQITHISEDLMDLSIELNIPIIVITQSNRGGVLTEEPELENIKDSDGISHNASIVISIKQEKEENLVRLALKKSRNSGYGAKLNYTWNIDTGYLTYIPQEDDGGTNTNEEMTNTRRRYSKDTEERF